MTSAVFQRFGRSVREGVSGEFDRRVPGGFAHRIEIWTTQLSRTTYEAEMARKVRSVASSVNKIIKESFARCPEVSVRAYLIGYVTPKASDPKPPAKDTVDASAVAPDDHRVVRVRIWRFDFEIMAPEASLKAAACAVRMIAEVSGRYGLSGDYENPRVKDRWSAYPLFDASRFYSAASQSDDPTGYKKVVLATYSMLNWLQIADGTVKRDSGELGYWKFSPLEKASRCARTAFGSFFPGFSRTGLCVRADETGGGAAADPGSFKQVELESGPDATVSADDVGRAIRLYKDYVYPRWARENRLKIFVSIKGRLASDGKPWWDDGSNCEINEIVPASEAGSEDEGQD